MSRAVRPARAVEAGAAEVSGACWTTVVVVWSPTAPAPMRTPAVTPPPITAAASGITTVRAAIRAQRGRCRSMRPKPRPALVAIVTAREGAAGGLDVGRAHQRLPDQHRVDADAIEVVELLAGGEAGLGDHRLARRDVGEQLVGALDVDREVGQVAVVEAED